LLPRIKFNVTRQESSPQSPTISYRHRYQQAEETTTIMKILLHEKHKMIGQPTFGTFASPNTQADASACKRAKFLPARTGDRNRICILQD